MRLTIIILLSLAADAAQAASYHVSAGSGDDARTALQAQDPATPWRTLDKCNAVFASLQPGDALLFKRGETFTGSLTIARSGALGSPIRIGAYGDAGVPRPVITGLQPVGAWTALGGGLYQATSPSFPASLNLVTVDGALQPMGRWPKLDSTNGGYWTFQSHVGTTSITSSDLADAPDYVGGEVVSRKYQWIMDRATIVTQHGTTLTIAPRISPGHPSVTYEPYEDNHGFFIQNHPATLTTAGEWSYASGTLTMCFPGGNPGAYAVQAATHEILVEVTGRSHVRFEGVAFSGSNAKTFGIVGSDHVEIVDCAITLSGLNGIDADIASSHLTVAGCTITRTNNNAIEGGSAQHWLIRDNLLQHNGMTRGAGQSGDGQYVGMSYIGGHSLVEFNRVIDTGYLGIHFCGDSVLIKNNFVQRFCVIKTDGGGIYTYGEKTRTGRRVIDNIVVDGRGDRFGLGPEVLANPYMGGDHGIYMDGGSTQVEITGNTTANCDASGYHLGSSRDITVRGNTAYNNSRTQLLLITTEAQAGGLDIRDNILFSRKGDQSVTVYQIAAQEVGTIGIIDDNFYCRPVLEPHGIAVQGYSRNAQNWDSPYNDGGIVEADWIGDPGTLFYSLDRWQAISGYDLNTIKTPIPFDPADPQALDRIRFEYNASKTAVLIPLDGIYADVRGATHAGSITLAPYASAVLIRTGTVAVS
ncbi:MAG: right-handed parallel beta-helix repeat-containing protein, partial [Planctomycetes bacterium]|nr:right-handed parallel beta-helix repeat-containing protein [Planctomycetota bacterium]